MHKKAVRKIVRAEFEYSPNFQAGFLIDTIRELSLFNFWAPRQPRRMYLI